VILVDANLLLYAYNPSFDRHQKAREWLVGILSKSDPVCLAWPTILAFLRIATNPRAFEYPLSIEEAILVVSDWLALPAVTILEPGDRHWAVLTELLSQTQVRGSAVMDAHLAALAIEHGAVLCTSDRDFARFPNLRMLNPLEATA
jgi:uncharacterized protein